MLRTLEYLTVQHHKQDKKNHPLYPVWTVAKFWGHAGYDWYAVTDDGELLCVKCVRQNYREIVADTKGKVNTGWRVVGFTNSGDMEENETCAHCGKDIGPDR